MDWLFGWITDWIKQGLIDAITGQYTGIFESVNSQVNDVAGQVGQTPQGWNGEVFQMIRTLSETVVLPIAGIILTFVLVYELIQMILEKNNMHDFDTFNIFKWIFKTFVATYILTNCFTIVMAVFDVAQHVVSGSAGVINGNLDVAASLDDLQTQLEAMGIWELIGLWLETNIIYLCMWILSIVIFVIVYGRMIEIYLTVSVAGIHQFVISHIEQHSKKPDIVRDKIVQLMGDLPRVELFARQKIPGWDSWGNEVDCDIALSPCMKGGTSVSNMKQNKSCSSD